MDEAMETIAINSTVCANKNNENNREKNKITRVNWKCKQTDGLRWPKNVWRRSPCHCLFICNLSPYFVRIICHLCCVCEWLSGVRRESVANFVHFIFYSFYIFVIRQQRQRKPVSNTYTLCIYIASLVRGIKVFLRTIKWWNISTDAWAKTQLDMGSRVNFKWLETKYRWSLVLVLRKAIINDLQSFGLMLGHVCASLQFRMMPNEFLFAHWTWA